MFCSRKQQQVGGAYDLKRASEHRDPGACPEGWHGVALAPPPKIWLILWIQLLHFVIPQYLFYRIS